MEKNIIIKVVETNNDYGKETSTTISGCTLNEICNELVSIACNSYKYDFPPYCAVAGTTREEAEANTYDSNKENQLVLNEILHNYILDSIADEFYYGIMGMVEDGNNEYNLKYENRFNETLKLILIKYY